MQIDMETEPVLIPDPKKAYEHSLFNKCFIEFLGDLIFVFAGKFLWKYYGPSRYGFQINKYQVQCKATSTIAWTPFYTQLSCTD